MVLAGHLIFAAYGFWLPNDPQGSGSDYVRSASLYRHGRATKVTRRVRRNHDYYRVRQRIKSSLKYPPVLFTGEQARVIGEAFSLVVCRAALVVHACSIMPDHAHLVIVRHRMLFETVAGQLKAAATLRLREQGLHPMMSLVRPGDDLPSPWARRPWIVYKDTPQAIRSAIAYVEENPAKAGLPRQHWSFVTPYAG